MNDTVAGIVTVPAALKVRLTRQVPPPLVNDCVPDVPAMTVAEPAAMPPAAAPRFRFPDTVMVKAPLRVTVELESPCVYAPVTAQLSISVAVKVLPLSVRLFGQVLPLLVMLLVVLTSNVPVPDTPIDAPRVTFPDTEILLVIVMVLVYAEKSM